SDLRETLEQMEIQNVELDLAKKRAQEAARIKSEFLANMSHELRTPLNGVIGFTRLTLKSELNPTQRDHLHTIERSANNLLTIINDVLDFSKLEAGKLILESIPFPLRSTLDDVVTLLAHSSHDKGLELTLNIKNDVPDNVIGDPLRLQQVITNLVGNAIKFTESGNIDILVEKRALSNNKVQ
ncbi:histidine kinase dimerization/phospho-acceptor domain-containing protein, partial [Enterobacter hormaechei]